MEAAEAEYFSKDFEWDELRAEVENDPSFRYHLLPFESSTIPSSQTTRATTAEEEEDSTAWKRFHIRHSSGKFFKERRYLLKEFPELVSCGESSKVLEVGCGNGSTALPILRGNEHIIVYACDCSSEILERAEEIIDAATVVSVRHRFRTFCCDFSVTGLPKWLACHTCREVFLQKQQNCLSDVKESHERHYNDSNSLKESTCCIGGLYDMTMLRFEPNQRVGFMEYMRSDGTRSYFFSLDTVRDLFVGAGFIELELEYCCVKSVNRRNEKTMQRVWVHGKFQKPM